MAPFLSKFLALSALTSDAFRPSHPAFKVGKEIKTLMQTRSTTTTTLERYNKMMKAKNLKKKINHSRKQHKSSESKSKEDPVAKEAEKMPDLVGGDEHVQEDEELEVLDDESTFDDGFVPVKFSEFTFGELADTSADSKHPGFLSQVLQDINSFRERDEAPKLAFNHPRLEGAWEQVEAHGERYVLCVSAEVDEERKYLRIGAIKDEVKDKESGEWKQRVVFNSVSDPLAILGGKAVGEEEERLEQRGASLEQPAEWEHKFPCGVETKHLQEFLNHDGSSQGGSCPMRSEKAEEGDKSLKFKLYKGRALGHIFLGDKGIASVKKSSAESIKNLPEEYDSRAQHPECAASVKDQGGCGSCYAFAAVSLVAERKCLAKKKSSNLILRGKKKMSLTLLQTLQARKALQKVVDLSQQDLVSCGSSAMSEYRPKFCTSSKESPKFTGGCDGATAMGTLSYVHYHGLSDHSCYPYVSGGEGGGDYSKHFDVEAGTVPKCSSGEKQSCHGASAPFYKTSFPIRCGEKDIGCAQTAIFQGGPVWASLTVHDSFFDYKGENAIKERWGDDKIYYFDCHDASDQAKGGHAVTLHGWGFGKMKDGSNADYWLGRNSWGDEWGLKGLFRMKKGSNNAGIENEIYYVEADKNFKPEGTDGECLKVVSDSEESGECVIENKCENQLRKGSVAFVRAYDGGSVDDCGSFVSFVDDLRPGKSHKIERAVHCKIETDEFIRELPPPGKSSKKLVESDLSYVDATTDQFRSWGYSCVVKRKDGLDEASLKKSLKCQVGRSTYSIHAEPNSLYLFNDRFCECETELYDE